LRLRSLVCTLITLPSGCAGAVNPNGPSQIAEEYLNSLVRGELGSGFSELMTHSDIDERDPDGIDEKEKQLEQKISRYGTPLRFEQVSVEAFGSSTSRLIYSTIHADRPLIWQFLFFRAESEWVLIELRYNDDPKYLLK